MSENRLVSGIYTPQAAHHNFTPSPVPQTRRTSPIRQLEPPKETEKVHSNLSLLALPKRVTNKLDKPTKVVFGTTVRMNKNQKENAPTAPVETAAPSRPATTSAKGAKLPPVVESSRETPPQDRRTLGETQYRNPRAYSNPYSNPSPSQSMNTSYDRVFDMLDDLRRENKTLTEEKCSLREEVAVQRGTINTQRGEIDNLRETVGRLQEQLTRSRLPSHRSLTVRSATPPPIVDHESDTSSTSSTEDDHHWHHLIDQARHPRDEQASELSTEMDNLAMKYLPDDALAAKKKGTVVVSPRRTSPQRQRNVQYAVNLLPSSSSPRIPLYTNTQNNAPYTHSMIRRRVTVTEEQHATVQSNNYNPAFSVASQQYMQKHGI